MHGGSYQWSYPNLTLIYGIDHNSTDEVLRQVCATFGIKAFQEEQQKAIDLFSEGFVTN